MSTTAASYEKAQQAGRVVDSTRYDSLMLVSVIALIALGTVMVFSATIPSDSKTLVTNYGHLVKHLVHISIGTVLLLIAASIKMEVMQRASRALLVFGLFMLAVLLLPGVGVEVNGSLRWINLGGVRFQPSEFMKIAALIYFADYLEGRKTTCTCSRWVFLMSAWL